MADEKETKKSYRAITTEPILFLYSLALFTNMPTTTRMLLVKVCLMKFDDMAYCKNTSNPDIGADDYIQKNLANWSLYGSLAYFLPAFVTALYAGSWGDKFGRKFPLLIPPFGFMLTSAGMAVFSKFIETVPIWVYALANVPSGLFGGELIIISASFSYVAEVSDEDNRIKHMSILQAMIIVAITAGPMLSLGILSISTEFAVYCTTAALAALALLYALFVLQRVDPVGGAQVINLRSLFGVQHVKDGISVIFKKRTDGRRKAILVTFAVLIINYFTSGGFREIIYLYVKDKPLSWEYSQFTTLISTMAAFSGFIMLFVLPVIRTFFDFRDTTVGLISTGADILGFVCMGLARNTSEIYIANSILVLSHFVPLSCRTVLSKLVESDEQGKVFSMNAVVENASFLTSSAAFNSLWPLTRDIFKGTLYEVESVLALFTFTLMIYLHLKLKKREVKRDPCECISVNAKDEHKRKSLI